MQTLYEDSELIGSIKTSRLLIGWEIRGVLGRGKRSVVFEIARKTPAGEEVSALKVIDERPSEDELERYAAIGMTPEGINELYAKKTMKRQREITAMQRLQGEPNIVIYHDYDCITFDDKPGQITLIRMEKLTPLREYLQFHPLTEKRLIQIAASVSNALKACHEMKPNGIIHGDVKPENIYCFKGDIFKLGDFGVSVDAGGMQADELKGTPFYAAPEHNKGIIQPSGDVYSLGRTLLRLIEGRNSSENAADEMGNRVGKELLSLIEDMTNNDPNERIGNLEQVLERLGEITPKTEEWFVFPDKKGTETVTDYLNEKSKSERELLFFRDFTADDSEETEEPEARDDSAVSDELEDQFLGEIESRKRHKKKTALIISATAVGIIVITVAVLVLIKQFKTVPDTQLTVNMCDQNELTCNWENARKGSVLMLCTAPITVSKDDIQQLPENGKYDISIGQSGTAAAFYVPTDGMLQIKGLAFGTQYCILLRTENQVYLQADISTANADEDKSFSFITHLLYSYKKADVDNGIAGKHLSLMENNQLVKMDTKTDIIVDNAYVSNNGLYIHLVNEETIEKLPPLTISLEISNYKFISYVSEIMGSAGVFGKNKIYIDLSELIKEVAGYIMNENTFILSVFSDKGIIYSFTGATNGNWK